MTHAKKFSLLGTDDWKSYAYFQAGVEWELQGEKNKAQQLFLKALDQDPKNLGASFNLSVLDVQAEEYERALQRLKRVKRDAWTMAYTWFSATPERTSVWYAALYQLATTYLYKSSLKRLSEEERQSILAQAREEANELTCTISDVLHNISRQPRTDAALRKYLERVQPMAEIVHAGIVILSSSSSGEEKTNAELKVKKIENSAALGELSHRTQYNLACFYSRLGMTTEDDTKKAEHYTVALCYLKSTLERSGTLAQWACKDPGLCGVREDNETLVRDNETAQVAFSNLITKYGGTATPEPNAQPPLAAL
jgi:tetratricopeptide (TPR) repeat protein